MDFVGYIGLLVTTAAAVLALERSSTIRLPPISASSSRALIDQSIEYITHYVDRNVPLRIYLKRTFLIYAAFFLFVMLVYRLFSEALFEQIVFTFQANTVIFLITFAFAWIICLVSFSQSKLFMRMLSTHKTVTGVTYIVLADVFMSMAIFIVLFSFFLSIISNLFLHPVQLSHTFKLAELCVTEKNCRTEILFDGYIFPMQNQFGPKLLFPVSAGTLAERLEESQYFRNVDVKRVDVSEDPTVRQFRDTFVLFYEKASAYEMRFRFFDDAKIRFFGRFAAMIRRNISDMRSYISTRFRHFSFQRIIITQDEYLKSDNIVEYLRGSELESNIFSDRELIYWYFYDIKTFDILERMGILFREAPSAEQSIVNSVYNASFRNLRFSILYNRMYENIDSFLSRTSILTEKSFRNEFGFVDRYMIPVTLYLWCAMAVSMTTFLLWSLLMCRKGFERLLSDNKYPQALFVALERIPRIQGFVLQLQQHPLTFFVTMTMIALGFLDLML